MSNRQPRWIILAAIFCLDLLCVAFSSIAIAPFAYLPLLGVILIGQSLFFMGFILGIARLTPLEANHPSFGPDTPAAIIIAKMEQTRTRLIAFDLTLGLTTLLLGSGFLVWGTTNWQPLILAVSLVILPLGFALVGHSFTLFWRQSAYEYARQAGVPATATLLKVTNTGINRPTRMFDPGRLYILELQVIQPTGSPYQVTLRQLIRQHPGNMPPVGSVIPVKYLPDQPQVVVALLNPGEKGQF